MKDEHPHMIDCQELGRRIFGYIDGELTPVQVAEIESHLGACGHCAETHEAERRLVEAIQSRRQSGDVSALQARVLAAIRAARNEPPPS